MATIERKMALLHTTTLILATIISILIVVQQCQSERVNNVAADSRAYTPDTSLDYIYHSQDEMTRFLR